MNAIALTELAAACDRRPDQLARMLLLGDDQALFARAARVAAEHGRRLAARSGGAVVGVPMEMRSLQGDDAETIHDQMTFNAPFVTGLVALAETYGMQVVSIPAQADQQAGARAAGLLAAGEVDALIVPNVCAFHPEALRACPRPCVLVNRPGHDDSPRVVIDMAAGIERAVAHLAARGHRRAMWVGPLLTAEETARAEAFDQACRDHDLHPRRCALPPQLPLRGRSAANAGAVADALEPLWPSDSPATAACCYNEVLAFGLYRLAERRGWRIPDDLAVIAIDDIYARGCDPPLTSLSNMDHRVATAALELTAERLLDLVPSDHLRAVIPELRVRASTGD